jgi:hypothetical protein
MKTFKTKASTELPLRDMRGKDYLDVAWRIVWLREEHPDWSIQTEFIYQDGQSALAKATITLPNGQIMATSHKEESLADFPAGYREKAETGAIGRALALCGYGTQFAPDIDEGERIVDSPQERPRPKQESATAQCPGCKGRMMVSKFPNKLTGLTDWYCSKCKLSVPREPDTEQDVP